MARSGPRSLAGAGPAARHRRLPPAASANGAPATVIHVGNMGPGVNLRTADDFSASRNSPRRTPTTRPVQRVPATHPRAHVPVPRAHVPVPARTSRPWAGTAAARVPGTAAAAAGIAHQDRPEGEG